MLRKRKNYTAEFKQEAVALALSAGSMSEVAKQLGIPKATLSTWIHHDQKIGIQTVKGRDGQMARVDVAELMDENKQLHKKLARLEQEKAILKKAATYFAKELG